MQDRIYLDNNATTALDPFVFQLFSDSLQLNFANPSSIHQPGQKAKAALVNARHRIASSLGVIPQEIVFTATATEALNFILRGCPSGHVITSNVEHAAVFRTLKDLEATGHEVSFLEASLWGAVHPEQVEMACHPDTRLITLMAANNETGVLTDIDAIAEIASSRNIPFVVDAVALFGKEPLRIHPGVSAICFSGHKFHAPLGASFMVVRKSFKLRPLLTGGEQEGGRRAGTENVPAIVALAEAVCQAQETVSVASTQMRFLRDSFESRLMAALPNIQINGRGPRVSNTSNLCFHGIDGEALLMYLDLNGIAASLGSACASGAIEPSRVLLNMGLDRRAASSSLRFSLSRYTTQEEITRACEVIINGGKRG